MTLVIALLVVLWIVGGLWLLSRWEPNHRVAGPKRVIFYPLWIERWRARRVERKIEQMIRQAQEEIETEEVRWRANQTIYFRYPDL